MSNRSEQILKDALSLPPSERAKLVEQILASFDLANQERIDELWALEVEERLNSLDRGEIRAIPAEEVFEELNKRKTDAR
jgi:putative addiction module component (TIGR02574 family)